jgi:tetratricopeptide (TPR) repeat protein
MLAVAAVGKPAALAESAARVARFTVPPSAADIAVGDRFAEDARASRKRGDLRAALHAWRRAARWNPDLVEAPAQAARVADTLGLADEAVGHAVLAIRADKRFGSTRDDEALVGRLARRAQQQSDWSAALELLTLRHRLAKPRGDERREAAYGAAIAASMVGDAELASDWFETVAEAFANDPRAAGQTPPTAWNTAVAGHVLARRFDRADRALASLASAIPEPGHVALWRATIASGRGEPTAALDLAHQALAEMDPSSSRFGMALVVYADALAASNQRDRLAAELGRLRRDHPTSIDTWLAWIDALAESGPTGDALDESQKLTDALLAAVDLHAERLMESGFEGEDDEEQEPFTPELFDNAVRQRVTLLVAAERADLLWPFLERAAERPGGFEVASDSLAETLAPRGAAPSPLAELGANWLAQIDADRASKRRLMAAMALATAIERFDLGEPMLLEWLTRPARAGEEPWLDSLRVYVVSRWARAAKDAGQPARAAEAIERALDLMGPTAREDAGLHQTLAECLAALRGEGPAAPDADRLAERAVAAIDKAIRLDPKSATTAANKVWLLARLGQRDAAIDEALAVVARLDPAESPATDPFDRDAINRLRSYATILLDERGAPGDAERGDELLEQVLDTRPLDAGARNDLAYRWSERREHLGRALRMAREALAAEPENAAFWDTLGWVEHRLGRHAEASATLAHAVALVERGETTADDAVLYEHWAAALEATGDHLGAERARARGERLKR